MSSAYWSETAGNETNSNIKRIIGRHFGSWAFIVKDIVPVTTSCLLGRAAEPPSSPCPGARQSAEVPSLDCERGTSGRCSSSCSLHTDTLIEFGNVSDRLLVPRAADGHDNSGSTGIWSLLSVLALRMTRHNKRVAEWSHQVHPAASRIHQREPHVTGKMTHSPVLFKYLTMTLLFLFHLFGLQRRKMSFSFVLNFNSWSFVFPVKHSLTASGQKHSLTLSSSH